MMIYFNSVFFLFNKEKTPPSKQRIAAQMLHKDRILETLCTPLGRETVESVNECKRNSEQFSRVLNSCWILRASWITRIFICSVTVFNWNTIFAHFCWRDDGLLCSCSRCNLIMWTFSYSHILVLFSPHTQDSAAFVPLCRNFSKHLLFCKWLNRKGERTNQTGNLPRSSVELWDSVVEEWYRRRRRRSSVKHASDTHLHCELFAQQKKKFDTSTNTQKRTV